MKKLIAAVFLFGLTTQVAFAATAQVNNVVQLSGGQNDAAPNVTLPTFTAVPGHFMIVGYAASYTHNELYRFFKNGSTSQYQVTTGKTFVADYLCAWGLANDRASVGTCSTTFSNGDSVCSSSGTLTPYGGTNSSHFLPLGPNSFAPICYKIPIIFGQNTYPYLSGATDSDSIAIWMMGQEL